ncbi:MAG: TlyA family RNA methyltransferase [Betaproteobacteria bacterium]|nr:TlyA family RNA methyltransferase [Betaproteobacteria bacterium]
MRADLLLVQRGLAGSRTLAQRLIAAGRVRAAELPVRKPAESLADDVPLSVAPGPEDRFVSRGGLKLAGALAGTGVSVAGLVCLDVGQSTGGFTDCLLQAGAARVVGIDVGHGQLDARLRHDARVVCLEGRHARDLVAADLDGHAPAGGFPRVVVDVSFISLRLVLPALAGLAAPGAVLIALVKPQFEIGPQGLDRRGIVRDPQAWTTVRERVIASATESGWIPAGWLDSPIPGGDGNREFFLHATRDRAHRPAPRQDRTLPR